MGRGEEASGGRGALDMADAFEALVGAIYLAATGRARQFIWDKPRPIWRSSGRPVSKPEGQLQNCSGDLAAESGLMRWCRRAGRNTEDICCARHWEGIELAEGTGRSKKRGDSRSGGGKKERRGRTRTRYHVGEC